MEGALGMNIEQQQQNGFRGNDEGAKIRSTTDFDLLATNSSGFSGKLGGFKSFNGGYANGVYGHWWTSSSNGNNAFLRRVVYINTLIDRYSTEYGNGFSLRCIKN
jgi:uncharacterized protein (TIGR02145 family)